MLTPVELLYVAGVLMPDPPCHPRFQERYVYYTNAWYRGFRDGYEGVDKTFAEMGILPNDQQTYIEGFVQGEQFRVEE